MCNFIKYFLHNSDWTICKQSCNMSCTWFRKLHCSYPRLRTCCNIDMCCKLILLHKPLLFQYMLCRINTCFISAMHTLPSKFTAMLPSEKQSIFLRSAFLRCPQRGNHVPVSIQWKIGIGP